MPGPQKSNPASTTGLVIPKADGRLHRPLVQLPAHEDLTDNLPLNKQLSDLRSQIELLAGAVDLLKQRLDRLRTDGVGLPVTFQA